MTLEDSPLHLYASPTSLYLAYGPKQDTLDLKSEMDDFLYNTDSVGYNHTAYGILRTHLLERKCFKVYLKPNHRHYGIIYPTPLVFLLDSTSLSKAPPSLLTAISSGYLRTYEPHSTPSNDIISLVSRYVSHVEDYL